MAIDTYTKMRRAMNQVHGLHTLVFPSYTGANEPVDNVHILNKYILPRDEWNRSIHYGVEIYLPGINSDNADIGMVDDALYGHSVIRLVTDRPKYDGVTIIPTWEDGSTNDDVWYEGILTNDGMTTPNRSIDLTGTGEYGTLSGFNFSVSAAMVAGTTAPFWQAVEDEGIVFFNRKIRLYVIIDDVFYFAWSGVISNNPYTEKEYTFVCKSDYLAVHKNVPPRVITETNFPDAIDDSKGKAIPICVGLVNYAQLLNTNGTPEFVNLVTDDIGGVWETAQAIEYDEATCILRIKTPYNEFDNGALTGYYLIAVAGAGVTDKARCIKILNSTSPLTTIPPVSPEDYWTDLYLSEPLDVSESTFNADHKYGSSTFSNVWHFKIARIGRDNVVSNAQVNEFKVTNGKNHLFEYSKESSMYIDVSDSFESSDNTLDTPIVTTNSNLVDVDGNIKNLSPMGIELISGGLSYVTGTVVSTSGAPSDMVDRRRETGYNVTASYAAVGTVELNLDVDADVRIGIGNDDYKFDEMYFGVDYIETYPATASATGTQITINFYDQYGSIAVTKLIEPPQPLTGSETHNYLTNDYYRAGGSDDGQSSNFPYVDDSFNPKTEFLIDSATVDLINEGVLSRRVSVKISINFISTYTGTLNFGLDVREIGFFGAKKIDTIGTNLYTRVNGEMSDSGAVKSDTVYGAFRLLLENYDDLTIGENDNSTDIDTDNLADVRHDATGNYWPAGLQITERRYTHEYLNDLCKNSFTVIYPNRRGQKKITAWLDRVDYIHNVHGAALIVRDSIGSFEKTKTEDTYNDFYVKYNFDGGRGKCTRALSVTKIEESSFPDESDMDADDNPVWWQYFGGINDYAAAKVIWDECHDRWLAMRSIRQFETECKWLPDVSEYDNTIVDGVGAESSAFKYLQNCIRWVTKERVIVEYEIPIDRYTMQLELCDPIIFNDKIYTNGVDKKGWICYIAIDTQKDLLIIKTILEPDL